MLSAAALAAPEQTAASAAALNIFPFGTFELWLFETAYLEMLKPQIPIITGCFFNR